MVWAMKLSIESMHKVTDPVFYPLGVSVILSINISQKEVESWINQWLIILKIIGKLH